MPILHDPLVSHTKLTVPRCTGRTVIRSRLVNQFANPSPLPLNIICAPAGFGKSTLAAQWIDQVELPTAWYSIESDDNDPMVWMRYFVASIRTVAVDFATSILQRINTEHDVKLDSLVPELLNQIAGLPQTLVLVLDDYQLIENEEIHKAFQQIISHQPQQLCLVIASRTELPLALAKLRVRRQVHEVTGEDLRFSHSEASDLMKLNTDLSLSKEDIEILERRTEGWAVGLQLAALSLKDIDHKEKYLIQSFGSEDYQIMQYLTKEVLNQQSEDIITFLQKTSVLDRLSGPLCDAVTGMNNCSGYLLQLAKSNMFLISLDNKRCWYRYHHLFSDLLRNQLLLEHPEAPAKLYLSASNWYSENGYPHDAMRYAFEHAAALGHDHESYAHAVDVLDRYVMQLIVQGQSHSIIKWFGKIPEKYIYSNPTRLIQYLWIAFIDSGEINEAELCKVEIRVRSEEADKNKIKLLNSGLLFLRAYGAIQQRNLDQGLELGWRSLKDFPIKMGPNMLIATGLYAKGLLRAAEIHYRDTIRKSIEEKYPIVLSASICGLGRTLMKQGRLRIAHNAIIAAISELKKQGIYHRLQGRSGLNLVLGEIAYKQNRLDKALEYLQQAKMESRQILVSDQYEEISRTVDVLHAVILWQQGSDTDAENTLLEISDLSVKPNRLPLFPPLSLYVARWLLLMGKSKQADNWVKEKKISIDDEVDASREDECLLLIQLLQYRQEYDQVVSLTSKLLPDAEQESRIDTILELLVQQAMALSRLNKREQAIECMHRALDMAEANGYVRIFLDEKEPVLSLLRDIVHSGKNSQYALNLLDQAALGHGDAAVYPVATNGSNTGLLSAAELNLLRLLAKGLTNKEIASQLNISNNTVKTHLKNIYTKLGVNSRAKAILIASEAGFSLE